MWQTGGGSTDRHVQMVTDDILAVMRDDEKIKAINFADAEGRTSLHYAAYNGHLHVRAGGRPSANLKPVACMHACMHAYLVEHHVLELLVVHGPEEDVAAHGLACS